MLIVIASNQAESANKTSDAMNQFKHLLPVSLYVLASQCFLLFILLAPQNLHAEEAQIGEVIDAKGDEFYRRDKGEGWQAIEIGMGLLPGDELRTGILAQLHCCFRMKLKFDCTEIVTSWLKMFARIMNGPATLK